MQNYRCDLHGKAGTKLVLVLDAVATCICVEGISTLCAHVDGALVTAVVDSPV